MPLSKIYPILDTAALQQRGCLPVTAARALLDAGAQILQIRNKGHWTRAFFEQSQDVAELCQKHSTELVVNDRADFAMLLKAGLHVGQDDLEPQVARRLIGPAVTLGFSTHNAEQLTAANGQPIHYVALGPIFATANKLNPDPEVGLRNLAECRALTKLPLVAIGGITLQNARAVLGAGADSLAIIGGLFPEDCSEFAIAKHFEEWQRMLHGMP